MRLRRSLLIGSLGVAVGAGLITLRRRGNSGLRGPVSHATARARRLKLARIGSRAGSSYAVHRARKVFASAGRREELDRRFEMKTAEQVASALGDMKGVLMKLGQMASFVDDGMPDAFKDALAQLQQDAPPMAP